MSEQVIVDASEAETKEEVKVQVVDPEKPTVVFEGTIKVIVDDITRLERRKEQIEREKERNAYHVIELDNEFNQLNLEIQALEARLAQIQPEVDKVEIKVAPNEEPIEPTEP